MRLGVFGGTFDPIHVGHVAAAADVADRLGIERILFVVARQQPLKLVDPMASTTDRCAMISLAIATNPLFQLDTREVERPAPSYTIDTLESLKIEYGRDCELSLLVGLDAVNSLPEWHEVKRLTTLCRLVIMSRSGKDVPDWRALERVNPHIRDSCDVVQVADVNISSSEIRSRIQERRSIRYVVGDDVRQYIYANGVYGASQRPAKAGARARYDNSRG